jgi:sugar lactone lactonase YvrE
MVPKVVVRVVAGFAVVLGTGGAAALAGGPATAGAVTPQAMPVPSTGVSAPTAFVANTDGNTITSYPLTASGDAGPANTISATPTSPLHQPWEIAFDGTGDLWAANCSSDAVIEYTAAQLASSGAKFPSVAITDDGSGSLVCPQGLAFDAAGDLWVGNVGSPTGTTGPTAGFLVEFTPAQLAHSGDPTPAVTITSTDGGGPPIAGPFGVTFDATGDLWVSEYDISVIAEYTATQLTSSGDPTPAGVIHGADITGPTGLTFDAAGDLWVANYGHGSTSGNSVVEITSTALAAGGTVTAAVVIGNPPESTGPLATPADVAFDATGNLWVTNTGNDTVVEYGATQLTSSGTPTPMVTLSPDATGSLDSPTGDAFDAAGGLWVANNGNSSLVQFSPAQLASSGSPTPAVTIAATGRASLQRPVGEAMDAAGDLWAANLDGNSLVEYTATQLGQSGPLDPAVTIRSNGENATPTPTTGPEPCVATPTTPSSTTGSLVCPAFMAFDSAGDLWVANYMGNTLVEYTPAQLAQSGDPAPAVTISAPDDCFTAEGTSITTTAASAAGLCGPAGLAFDAHGDLWVTNLFLPSVVEYTPAQLAQSGSPTPATVIGTTNPTTSTGPHSLLDPLDDTFDAAGNLWVSNAVYSGPTARGTLVEYTPAQLAHSGAPTPAVTISSTGGTSTGTGPASLSAPSGLELDTTGNLWVANTGNDSLVEYTPAQLAHSGAPAPADTIAGTATGLDGPNGLAIAVPPPPPPPANGQGYWEVASDGGIFAFGNAQFYGSMGGKPLNAPVVGIAATPTGGGYWEVAADGGIFAFGNAQFYGSMGGKPLNKPVVGIAAAPTGQGYWEVASDGGIFAFGSAQFYGSMGGKPLNEPVNGIAATSTGGGYWEVASDGGIFAFGNAQFYGSMGGKPLNQPVQGIATPTTGEGYWEVASDGGIFSFGSAQFQGSMGGKPLNRPVVGIAAV